MTETPAAQIAVILSGGAFLFCVMSIAAYRPVIFLAFFFIFFSLASRISSTMYIDLAGPVLSSQTERYIGPGLVTPLHVLACFLTIMPLFMLVRPDTIESWKGQADRSASESGSFTLSDATFVLSAFFLLYLFVDMVRHGTIPLFAHMERFVYTAQYAGAAHRWLTRYGNFVAFWWGVMFAAERLRNRRTDFRYLGLLVVLLGYMLLTGNRFSAFYSFGSYFIAPISAALAAEISGDDRQRAFHWMTRRFSRLGLATTAAAAVVLALVVAGGIYNNLVNVRGYRGREVASQFVERAFVQPSEMGWISFERVFNFDHWHPARVYDFLFQHPLDPTKNTTPQYLMLETIGEPRTSEHIFGGFQFAGGFPEIFFELFGPIFAWPFIFGTGYIAAALTALMLKSVLQGRYASAFLSLYVLYGFDVMYIGGMLNFVTVTSYWIKVAALAGALAMEWWLARAGATLVPWTLFRMSDVVKRRIASAELSSKAKR